MTNKVFYEEVMAPIFESCLQLARAKGADYTKGSADALANFKEEGKNIDLDPKKVCHVYMNKHYQAITNFIRTNGQAESEPIAERIKDMINYLVLLQGLIVEEKNDIRKYPATPDESYEIKKGDIAEAGKQSQSDGIIHKSSTQF